MKNDKVILMNENNPVRKLHVERSDGEEKTRDKVSRLTILGYKTSEIAETLGISTSAVNYHQKNSKHIWREEAGQPLEEIIAQEYEYLRMLRYFMSDAIVEGSPTAIELSLKVSDRMSKLLGLDRAETNTNITITTEQIRQYRDRLLETRKQMILEAGGEVTDTENSVDNKDDSEDY